MSWGWGVPGDGAPGCPLALTAAHAGVVNSTCDALASVLTESQLRVFRGVVHHKLQCVWGPPGCGKTYFSATLILGLVRLARVLKWTKPLVIFVTAFTNVAVDCLKGELEKLCKDAQWRDEASSLDIISAKLSAGASVGAGSDGSGRGRGRGGAAGRGRGKRVAPDARPGGSEAGDDGKLCRVIFGTTFQLVKMDEEEVVPDMLVVDEGSQMPLYQAGPPPSSPTPLRYTPPDAQRVHC